MKKVVIFLAVTFLGSLSFYSCTTGHGGGGCDAFGGSHTMVVKQDVGKSL